MKPVIEFDRLSRCIPIALGVALAIAGCSSKEKNVIIDPQPQGITIQHDSRYGSMAGVDADEHCAKYGKVAVFDRTIKPDEGTLLRYPNATQTVYDCVDAKAAN